MDWEEAPKRFQKPNLHQKKVMVSGGLLPVWATTTFGIPEKPLYLRRMLSKSMRCTKLQCLQPALVNKKGPILHSNAWPCNHITNTSKVEQIGLRSFASSTILIWPLTNQLSFLQASQQLYAEKTHNQREAENAFKKLIDSWSTDFYGTRINNLISHWQKYVDCNDSCFDN